MRLISKREEEKIKERAVADFIKNYEYGALIEGFETLKEENRKLKQKLEYSEKITESILVLKEIFYGK